MLRVHGSFNSSALLHNLSIARQLTPAARLLAVVKKNAYGHGLIRVAEILDSKVDGFAVASVEEAVSLRQLTIEKPILVLSGFFSPRQTEVFSDRFIQPVIYCEEQLEWLAAARLRELSVWVKFDTGMNRLGFPIEKCEATIRAVRENPVLRIMGLMTHFACADDLSANFTHQQIETFNRYTAGWMGAVSLANSAGILRWPASCRGWVRPGIMLYGASPFATISAEELGLKPVLNLYSTIIAIKTLPAGAGVGYGQTWVCSETTRIGLIAAGYGDGYLRSASGKAYVLINNRKARVLGRISMDSFAVDLKNIPEPTIGTPVKLFGEGLPVEDLSAAAGTIPYEIFTSLSPPTVSLAEE